MQPPPQGPWDPNNPHAQNPYAQNPQAQNPYAQSPQAQNPYVQNPYAPPQAGPNPYAQQGWGPPGYGPPFDPREVQGRLDNLNKMSFAFGVPGLMLQVVGNMSAEFVGGGISTLISLSGSVLLIVGLGYYAMSRGHSKWFGALGFLSCIGLIVLALLPKKCLVCTGPVQRAFCQRCGAPGAK
jgi:hypothetical protein